MSSMYSRIEEKLKAAFSPEFLDVIDESHQHGGGTLHETHFKVVIVTRNFDGLRLLQRHRAVNETLKDELRSTVHALALHTYTPEEWHKKSGTAPISPACRGGSKLDA
ncbi:BolA family protein [Aliidiomarina haloalkalitolerans]